MPSTNVYRARGVSSAVFARAASLLSKSSASAMSPYRRRYTGSWSGRPWIAFSGMSRPPAAARHAGVQEPLRGQEHDHRRHESDHGHRDREVQLTRVDALEGRHAEADRERFRRAEVREWPADVPERLPRRRALELGTLEQRLRDPAEPLPEQEDVKGAREEVRNDQ